MKNIYLILITLVIGLAFGGMYVQYRMTGHIWTNRPIVPIEKWKSVEECWNKEGTIFAYESSRRVECKTETRTEIYSSYGKY